MKLQKLWTVELVVTRDEPGARNVYIESTVKNICFLLRKHNKS